VAYCEAKHACPIEGCPRVREDHSPCCGVHIAWVVRRLNDELRVKDERRDYGHGVGLGLGSLGRNREGMETAVQEMLNMRLEEENERLENMTKAGGKWDEEDVWGRRGRRERSLDSGLGSEMSSGTSRTYVS